MVYTLYHSVYVSNFGWSTRNYGVWNLFAFGGNSSLFKCSMCITRRKIFSKKYSICLQFYILSIINYFLMHLSIFNPRLFCQRVKLYWAIIGIVSLKNAQWGYNPASLRFIRRLTPYNVSVRTWASCAVEITSGLELITSLGQLGSYIFASHLIFMCHISLESWEFALFNDMQHSNICPAVKDL